MIISWINYKTLLPESLHEKFCSLANRSFGRPIIYTGQVLRYATVEEA